jgi:hypothetical protein
MDSLVRRDEQTEQRRECLFIARLSEPAVVLSPIARRLYREVRPWKCPGLTRTTGAFFITSSSEMEPHCSSLFWRFVQCSGKNGTLDHLREIVFSRAVLTCAFWMRLVRHLRLNTKLMIGPLYRVCCSSPNEWSGLTRELVFSWQVPFLALLFSNFVSGEFWCYSNWLLLFYSNTLNHFIMWMVTWHLG